MVVEQVQDPSAFHCGATWGQVDMEWQGISFMTLIDLAQPKPEATPVYYKGFDGYSTNTTLEAVGDDDTLIALTWNGPNWVSEIIFLNRDILGFWEVRGYSNPAVPWRDDFLLVKNRPHTVVRMNVEKV